MADEDEEQEQAELAHANNVRVLETNVLHASDVIYWLDATSAELEADMNRINHPLAVSFSEKPRRIKVLNSVGKMALWESPTEGHTPDEAMIDGYATEVQRTRPVLNNFNVVGEVQDPAGRYNPSAFSATLGSGNGVSVLLYPTVVATRRPPAGIAQGHLQFASGEGVAWGLIELEVTVALNETITFRAQADGKGDFVMALSRLPPLPESVTEYAAVLRLSADAAASADSIPNPNSFAVMELESATVTDDFQTDFVFNIRPGEITRINSFNKDHLAIQPA